MTHSYQNKKNSALRTRNHQVELKEDPINTTYRILNQFFKVLDEEYISGKHIIPWLATLSNKKRKCYYKYCLETT